RNVSTLQVVSSTGSNATIPAATSSLSGLIAATSQTIGGQKTWTERQIFNNGLIDESTGISLHSDWGTSTYPRYGLVFRETAHMGNHGDVTGTHATFFTMDAYQNRGWIWKASNASGT